MYPPYEYTSQARPTTIKAFCPNIPGVALSETILTSEIKWQAAVIGVGGLFGVVRRTGRPAVKQRLVLYH